MPWTAKDADRHNKGLTKHQKHVWATVANAVLKTSGGDEGKAVRIANAISQRSPKKKPGG